VLEVLIKNQNIAIGRETNEAGVSEFAKAVQIGRSWGAKQAAGVNMKQLELVG
jgi:hypothetical protein